MGIFCDSVFCYNLKADNVDQFLNQVNTEIVRLSNQVHSNYYNLEKLNDHIDIDDDKLTLHKLDGIDFETDTARFTSNVIIQGNLIVEGNELIANVETINVSSNTLLINSGEPGNGVSHGTAGIVIDRGGFSNYNILYDEIDNKFKVGHTDSMEAVALEKDIASISNMMSEIDINIDKISQIESDYMPVTGHQNVTGIFKFTGNHSYGAGGFSVEGDAKPFFIESGSSYKSVFDIWGYSTQTGHIGKRRKNLSIKADGRIELTNPGNVTIGENYYITRKFGDARYVRSNALPDSITESDGGAVKNKRFQVQKDNDSVWFDINPLVNQARIGTSADPYKASNNQDIITFGFLKEYMDKILVAPARMPFKYTSGSLGRWYD